MMIRVARTILVLALTFAVSPAVAQSSLPLASAGHGLPAPEALPIPSPDRFLLEIPADSRQVHLTYRIDGETVFAERLELGAPSDPLEGTSLRPVAVVLLAWHPDVAEALLAAEATGSAVTVEWHGGSGSGTLVLDALRQDTVRLREMGPIVVNHGSIATFEGRFQESSLSPSTLTKAQYSPDPDCTLVCRDAYDDCYDECNLIFSQPDECEARCDWEHEQCEEACPLICVGPSSEDTTETDLIAFQYFGPSVCLSGFGGNSVYDYGRATYQTTTTRTTSHCDGTTTTEVVSTSTFTLDCYLQSGYCSSPQGYTYQVSVCPPY